MSTEFQEKLQLYRDGKLSQDQVAEIEADIEKFIAISDYLDDDEKGFIEDLRQPIPMSSGDGEGNIIARQLKRKVNFRIVLITALTAFSALVIFIILYFTVSRITTSLFALNYKEAYVKRETMVQFAQMLQPKYKSNQSGVSSSLFAQQNISVSLEDSVGNTKIEEIKINVKYKFGKPVRSDTGVVPPLIYEDFPYFIAHESVTEPGFKTLENAPHGTKAKILIEFSKALTAQQIKEYFSSKINSIDNEPLNITPIAAIGSKLILANPSYYQFRGVFPYDKNNAKQLSDNGSKQTQFESMSNEAHKDSLIGNLKLIKNNLKLLQVMYYEDLFKNINMDDMIQAVNKNGAEYVGMYISADSKELLKLNNSPHIHCMRVQNIVLW